LFELPFDIQPALARLFQIIQSKALMGTSTCHGFIRVGSIETCEHTGWSTVSTQNIGQMSNAESRTFTRADTAAGHGWAVTVDSRQGARAGMYDIVIVVRREIYCGRATVVRGLVGPR
jgi:hypothetical protein